VLQISFQNVAAFLQFNLVVHMETYVYNQRWLAISRNLIMCNFSSGELSSKNFPNIDSRNFFISETIMCSSMVGEPLLTFKITFTTIKYGYGGFLIFFLGTFGYIIEVLISLSWRWFVIEVFETPYSSAISPINWSLLLHQKYLA
jgi:hypothetical protein